MMESSGRVGVLIGIRIDSSGLGKEIMMKGNNSSGSRGMKSSSGILGRISRTTVRSSGTGRDLAASRMVRVLLIRSHGPTKVLKSKILCIVLLRNLLAA